ncbi:MAG: hypothetical protein K2J73_06845 [Oscillospiraceae bacterium]|nr:hypothetical protein [Oscillospiraceae bacterium]
MVSIFRKKSSVAAIAAVFLLAVILKFLMDSEIFIATDPADRAISTEQRNENFSEVFNLNRRMLNNVAEYGDKYCSGYVSTKDDYELHKRILMEVQMLSDEICAGAETDYEKVLKIEYWVADNIYYNYVSAETAVTADVICLETVLETKTATCAGYSNLFSALCNMQGIYCINLRGGTYISKDTPDQLMEMPMNHEWNAVMLDEEWIFIDTTWLSNNSYTAEDGYVRSGTMDEQYFHMTFEYMSYEHRIDIADYRDFKSSINVFE